MNSTLYKKLFDKLDSLSSIRKTLELGCEVYSTEYDTYHSFLYTEFTGNERITVTQCISHIPTIERWNEGELEIIGYPPVLSDVLKALKENQNICIPNGRFYSDSYIHARDFDDVAVTCKGTCELTVSKWNLSQPLLSEQSDELGEYLLTLLG